MFGLLHTDGLKAQEPVHSPHASPVPAPKVKVTKDDDDEKFFEAPSPVEAESWGPKTLKFIGNALIFIIKLLMYVKLLNK